MSQDTLFYGLVNEQRQEEYAGKDDHDQDAAKFCHGDIGIAGFSVFHRPAVAQVEGNLRQEEIYRAQTQQQHQQQYANSLQKRLFDILLILKLYYLNII